MRHTAALLLTSLCVGCVLPARDHQEAAYSDISQTALRGVVDASAHLTACAKQYATAHVNARLAASELAQASVSACSGFSNDVLEQSRTYYRNAMAAQHFRMRPDELEASCQARQRKSEGEAFDAVLRLLAETP